MATIKAVSRKRDKSGKTSLYLRVSKNNKTKYLSLKLKVPADDWSSREGRVRASSKVSYKANTLIESALTTARESEYQLRKEKKRFSIEQLVERMRRDIMGAPDADGDFYDYADQFLAELSSAGQVGYCKTVSYSIDKLRTFTRKRFKSDRLPFSALDAELLRAYMSYMKTELGNGVNTVNKNMRHVRAILYKAIKEGIIKQEQNPFFQITLKSKKTSKSYVPWDEITMIEELELEPDTPIWHARNYWLFSLYSGGTSFSDIAKLKGENLIQDGSDWRLRFHRKKVGTISGNVLVEKAIAILDLYGGPHAISRRDGYIFPILEGLEDAGEWAITGKIESANAYTNRMIQKCAHLAGVRTHITFHLARHSVAKLLLDEGWGIHSISEVLGHSSIKQTETYLAGFRSKKQDDKLKSFFGQKRLGG